MLHDISSLLAEEAIEFTKTLQDQVSTKIPDTITFECELSSSDVPVDWLHNGRSIKRGVKYSLKVDGRKHKLIIKDVDSRDAGSYSVECKGKACSAELRVECEYLWYYGVFHFS